MIATCSAFARLKVQQNPRLRIPQLHPGHPSLFYASALARSSVPLGVLQKPTGEATHRDAARPHFAFTGRNIMIIMTYSWLFRTDLWHKSHLEICESLCYPQLTDAERAHAKPLGDQNGDQWWPYDTYWILLIPYVTLKYLKHQRNSQNMSGSPDQTHQDPKPRYDAAIFSCKGTWEHPWSQWRTALRNLTKAGEVGTCKNCSSTCGFVWK